eukprot:6199173-Pleurochrysis_carterae.AAC.1
MAQNSLQPSAPAFAAIASPTAKRSRWVRSGRLFSALPSPPSPPLSPWPARASSTARGVSSATLGVSSNVLGVSSTALGVSLGAGSEADSYPALRQRSSLRRRARSRCSRWASACACCSCAP